MRRNAARLGFEILEGRDCPASANLTNGILTVTGTDAADTITVTESNGVIQAAGQGFVAGAVSTIVISGLGGNDTIRDDTTKRSVIYGGSGDDWIYAGRGNDVVYGGHGDDLIFGGPGDDRLLGGEGNDSITDNGGNNVIRQGSPNPARGNTAFEIQVIDGINAYRVANGLSALVVNPWLNNAADLHSLDMADASNRTSPSAALEHTLFGNTQPGLTERLDASGYDRWTRSTAYGENIAYGYFTADAVVQGWINSPGHRANILNTSFTETGVSVRYDASGIPFYTQTFGFRS